MMKYFENIDFRAKSYLFSYRNTMAGSEFHRLHAHQGFEFLYIHEGEGTIITEGRICRAGPGMLFMFQPYQLHSIRMGAGDSPYIRSVFAFEPSWYDAYLKPLGALYDFFQYLWRRELPVQCLDDNHEDGNIIPALFAQLHSQLQNGREQPQLQETAVFLICLLQQLRSRRSLQPAAVFPVQRSLYHAERIMDWVERHYREPFDLKKAARELHLSPPYVSRFFRQATGSSITEYLTALRLRKACGLLRQESWSVERIAEEVGYGSTSYFCQLFKKEIGTTPHQYRVVPAPIHTDALI